MFMGLLMHFYIIFRTNLLTQGPVQIVVFCLFQCFEEKEYQTESKRNETFWRSYFWKESNLIDLECTSGESRGTHKGGGRAQGGRARPHPCGQLGTLLAQLFYSGGFFWSIKNHQKLARQLDSVWYSFSIKLKNKGKIETGTGL